MKKLYITSIVFLVSLIAVSAGQFPDTDNDGICETPFCNKLDLCPKVACEQLHIPVENCQKPDNTDSDGDGAGDVCDECPNDRLHIQKPCTTPPSVHGGGGGGSPSGCRSHTDFNAQFHQAMGWTCITDSDCQTTAKKLGKNPNDYSCTVTKRVQGAGANQNTCQCALIKPATQPATAAPSGSVPLVAPAETSQRELSPRQAAPAGAQMPYAPQSPVGQRGETSGIGWIIPTALLLALALGAFFIWRRRQ